MQLNAIAAARDCWTVLWPDSTSAMLFRRVFPEPKTWFDNDLAVFLKACTTMHNEKLLIGSNRSACDSHIHTEYHTNLISYPSRYWSLWILS